MPEEERYVPPPPVEVVAPGYVPPHGWEVWDLLASCESNNTWDINTGNSFYGGLQFNKMSWDWAGGEKYAEYPHQATREQQIEIAENLLSIHPAGWGAWPACTKKLGIRK